MSELRKLTDRQAKILQFVIDCIMESGIFPTIREVGDKFGIASTNGVFDHLNALTRKGYLERALNKHRSMKILRYPDGTVFVEPRLAYGKIVGELKKLKRWAKNGKSKVTRDAVVERLEAVLDGHEKAA